MLSSAVYPASKKKSRKNREPTVVAEEKTAISSDRTEELKNKKYTYFSSVSETVLADVVLRHHCAAPLLQCASQKLIILKTKKCCLP